MNIIINGGTRGIGKEVVIFLAGDPGNKILVTGRNTRELESLTSRFKNVNSFALDLSVFEEYEGSFRKKIKAFFSEVDILVNVAGLLISKPFTDISEKEARMMLEVNFLAPAAIIKAVKPFMTKGSHVLNISSMGGFQGSSKYSGLSYYSASKAALACLTECLAAEFEESGICVNCLALGSVQTEMLEEAFPGYKAPVQAREMAEYISDFALKGHKFFNGKILPVAVRNP